MPCSPCSRRRSNPHRLRILLTNGRFPVSIDLARQLYSLSHTVFVVDPMHYHVCKFSRAVHRSFSVPSPHVDSLAFIGAVKTIVERERIDLIIPMHEEIFYLAESQEPEITKRMLAPRWDVLFQLHNKWTFTRFLQSAGLAAPEAYLCKTRQDIIDVLSRGGEWAVKPCYGRAASRVFKLDSSKPIPELCDVSEENQYIAQRWITGKRYCSYMVVRSHRVQAFSLYPVMDTIDGSSCVYFQSVAHPQIEDYVTKLASHLPEETCAQLAFDFVETDDGVMAIECNPRSTSGVHLFSGTPLLAQALVSGAPAPARGTVYTTFTVIPPQGASRQLAPGMMMWKRSERGPKAYLVHMRRLVTSKDVIFSGRDLLPSLMQPFLLTSYYEICRERRLNLPEMFQWDLVWEPKTGITWKKHGKLLEIGEKMDNDGRISDVESMARDSGVAPSE